MAKAGPAGPVPPPLESFISYKLLAACIVARLSVDSILNNNLKTLIVCRIDNGSRCNTQAALIKVPNHTKYPEEVSLNWFQLSCNPRNVKQPDSTFSTQFMTSIRFYFCQFNFCVTLVLFDSFLLTDSNRGSVEKLSLIKW